ncbi:MAG: hypothetical protein AB200_03010 [Parcubacteria bacterium C7867-005]|nr:MAG: hypothetical protein AB200_03010 [Parcubacteria bacterium C7867-005]
MADFKKEAPKMNLFTELVFFLVAIYFLLIVVYRLYDYVLYWGVDNFWAAVVVFFVENLWPAIRLLGAGMVIASVFGIVYNQGRLKKLVKEEQAIYNPIASSRVNEEVLIRTNPKWETVLKHINSVNVSDWKLAIIEADIMLDELLQVSGYHGDSLGEMLKSVEKSDFLTIESAWEAHKIRNQITHQGADFNLSEREAKRIVALYESVFREFRIIDSSEPLQNPIKGV